MYNIMNNYKNAQNNCANVQMFSIILLYISTRDVSHFKYTIFIYACLYNIYICICVYMYIYKYL